MRVSLIIFLFARQRCKNVNFRRYLYGRAYITISTYKMILSEIDHTSTSPQIHARSETLYIGFGDIYSHQGNYAVFHPSGFRANASRMNCVRPTLRNTIDAPNERRGHILLPNEGFDL